MISCSKSLYLIEKYNLMVWQKNDISKMFRKALMFRMKIIISYRHSYIKSIRLRVKGYKSLFVLVNMQVRVQVYTIENHLNM